MNIRIEHSWVAAELAQRLEQMARDHGVSVDTAEGGSSGRLRHTTPMGEVRASYRITATVLEVEVEKKPAFLPADMVRRRLEEGLRDILSRRP